VQLTNRSGGRGPSSARSLTSVALLQIRQGDAIVFSIQGEDASAAAAAIGALAATRFGEGETSESAQDQPQARPSNLARMDAMGALPGVAISEGIAIGRVQALSAVLPEPEEVAPGSPEQEQQRLDAALRQVTQDLRDADHRDGAAADILAAQALVLSDPILLEAVAARLLAGDCSAAAAWRLETSLLAESYAAMEDDYLRARK
jgi:phosphocarrier protein FPr